VRSRYILGISASHNGSACLLEEDRIHTAVSEERLSRRKRQRIYGADPALCVQYCLDAAGITADRLDRVVVAPQKKGHRVRHDVGLNPLLRVHANGIPTERVSHHYAHAVSAFVPSGFDNAAVLVVDGIGSAIDDMSPDERAAIQREQPDGHEVITIYRAEGRSVVAVAKQLCESESWLSRDAWHGPARQRMPRFRSLGGMFSAVATQLFGDSDEAGKVMGLAAYGKPTIPVSDFLTFEGEEIVFHDTVPLSFVGVPLWPAHERAHADLAASVQAALEVAMLHLAARTRRLTGRDRLCLAGGVALNGLANQRIMEEQLFDDVFVVPAADDSGAAFGAAYHGAWTAGVPVKQPRLRTDSVGACYSAAQVDQAIETTPALSVRPRAAGRGLVEQCAELLSQGSIIGWFQGGSELGPRALGHRSILCDPRRPDGKERLNSRVKHREAFRPFAASILEDEVERWVDTANTPPHSPFMLRVLRVRPEMAGRIPAVVHPDGTCRIQSVSPHDEPRYHMLIAAFHAATGVPMILNTSLNVMGEPIAETPEDALWTLLYTQLDYCVIEDRLVSRAEGYSSVLELVPRPREGIVVRRERTCGGSDEVVTAQTQTRWGPMTVALDARSSRVLDAADGRLTAAEIWKALVEGEPQMEEPQFLRTLATLRRGSLISFSWPGRTGTAA
jgi:carbamoyltransferase